MSHPNKMAISLMSLAVAAFFMFAFPPFQLTKFGLAVTISWIFFYLLSVFMFDRYLKESVEPKDWPDFAGMMEEMNNIRR